MGDGPQFEPGVDYGECELCHVPLTEHEYGHLTELGWTRLCRLPAGVVKAMLLLDERG
jgi:hypothetical protein